MSFTFGVAVHPSQLLPTERNLSGLLEKLLTVFGDESILDGGGLPSQPLQREIGDVPRYALRPMVGNDFHVQTSFGSSPSWKAVMQLDRDDEKSDKICLPLCDVTLQSESEATATIKLAQQMAKLLRYAWPDANVVGPSKRRQLGPPFVDPALPDYQLFQWLASKDLNPVSEGIMLIHFYGSKDWFYRPLRQVARGLAVKPSPETDRTDITVHTDSGAEEVITDGSVAQIWSFTGPDSWVISLPVVATILLLMTHPTKEVNPLPDNPDRDLSWTLDSLHGFCRKEGLEDGDRHLSWSLGTFADCWMYFNFIFFYFTPHDVDADEWIGSGIRCDRRSITVRIGDPERKETFREQRVWLSMRTATPYESGQQADADKLKGPDTVGVVLADAFHHRIGMTKKEWLVRDMEPAKGHGGVKGFQMLLWGGVEDWSRGWNACLDYVDRLHQVQVSDIDNSDPYRLHYLMFDLRGGLAKEYFVTANLLKMFRQHIDVLPRSLKQMRSKWEMTYPGVDSDLLQRFDNHTQLALLRNWSRLIEHADALHGKLADRIEKRSGELLSLRNNLMIARDK
ncbi:uncharacterized protein B0H64DRAFT_391334 [Chaetomium fimeti]|uniref:Uncharacterized protein n=1 Tax=Chaetomium fimeti TaxID=1854472 RepID=A0AAE0HIC6_9PEZI|nr:hypothetical protein B0H64DRAFT_391334 [Chaetomium fimeti]